MNNMCSKVRYTIGNKVHKHNSYSNTAKEKSELYEYVLST